MRQAIVALAILVLFGAYAGAQMTPSQPSSPAPVATSDSVIPEAQTVWGRVKALDGQKKTLTLEDGTKLTFPQNVKVTPVTLKEGAIVKAVFEEQGGLKVVTSIEVEPRYRNPSGSAQP